MHNHKQISVYLWCNVFPLLSEAFLSSAHGDLCPPSMPVPRLQCQTVLGAQVDEINYIQYMLLEKGPENQQKIHEKLA